MKTIFLILLAIPVAAADTEILVPGPIPLTRASLDRFTNFFEWALGAKLGPAERAAVEQKEIAAWTAAPAKTQEIVGKLLAARQQIEAMPPGEREQMRRQVRAALVQQFSPASTIPAQLLGEWTSVSTSTVTFRDQATGSYAPPSGEGISYRFTADGRFHTAAFIQSSIGACTTAAFITEDGQLVVNGQTFILDSQGGEIDSKDNCVRSSNYRKSIPARQYVHTAWRIDRDQWGERLCLVSGGKERCYRRK